MRRIALEIGDTACACYWIDISEERRERGKLARQAARPEGLLDELGEHQ
jgi:hypothetical protein